MDNKSVLIVDDLEINRMMLSDIFEENGYTVLQAENGAQALAILREHPERITLVVLDLIMPVMDGFAVLEQMKHDEVLTNIPVVVNTVAGEQENELRALKLGASDFITKPYIPEIVMRRSENLLERILLGKKLAQKHFQELEAAFDMLTEIMPGGVATFRLVEDDIQTVFYNKGFAALSGRTKEEYIDEVDNILSVIHESDRAALLEQIRKSSVSGMTMNETCRIVHKNGDVRWVRFTASRYLANHDNQMYIAVVLDITEDIELQMQFKHRLDHDSLTGIWNREAFCRMTQKMIREKADVHFILMRMDVDNFKVINELFGTKAGDEVLRYIAATVAANFEVLGTYCRLEADHFACCIPKEHLNIIHFAARLEESFAQLRLGYTITARYGIYEIDDTNLSVDLMCDRAHQAICTISTDAPERYAYYDTKLRTEMLKEQDIVANMNIAMEERQFQVYLQPLFRASTQQVCSAEALIRWSRPGKGIVSPGDFLPVFEKNGFITKIDMFVWEEVCCYLAERIRAGKAVVPISVNMSRLNIYNPKLFDNILALVQHYNISPTLLKFEITENLFIENQSRINELVAQLQGAGFSILMDDFGSGYSSLNTLKDLPVDILKIDRGFITDISTSERGACILSTIIRLSQRLNIPVVAEGIETKEQFDYLRGLGCDSIQGYFFSKPLPIPAFSELLDRYEDVLLHTDDFLRTANTLEKRLDRKCVLVVDDNVINRKILHKMLSDSYDVLEAENGQDALEQLRAHPNLITIVLLDIVMPVMNGYEFLRALRSEVDFVKLPVIVMTEADSAESEIMALEVGANDYLRKPYDAMTIKLRIANLLRMYEKQSD